MEEVRERNALCEALRGEEEGEGEKDGGGCAEIGVQEAVERVLIGEHEVEGFDVDEDVDAAEGKEADVFGCDGVCGGGGAEVKGSEGHRIRTDPRAVMFGNASQGLSTKLFYIASQHLISNFAAVLIRGVGGKLRIKLRASFADQIELWIADWYGDEVIPVPRAAVSAQERLNDCRHF